MFRNRWQPPYLRFVGDDDAGGGGGNEPDQKPGTPGGETPSDKPEEIDYKAKYEEAIAHSRKWEARAKENHDKASKFDEAEAAKLTEIERERQRAEKAEQAAAANAAELLQLRVANANGITAEERVLLTATTEEALAEQAKTILAFRKPAGPTAQQAGITAGGGALTNKPANLSDAIRARYETQQ